MEKEEKFVLKIEEKGSDKVIKQLDEIKTRTKAASTSVEEMAKIYQKGFNDIAEAYVLAMAKLGVTTSEIADQTKAMADKNAKEIEKVTTEASNNATEAIISDIKKAQLAAKYEASIIEITAKDLSTTIVSSGNSVSDNLKKQSEDMGKTLATVQEKFVNQKTINDGLIAEDLKVITEKYKFASEEIGLFNIEAHKKNIDSQQKALKEQKTALNKAIKDTEKQYDNLIKTYQKDSKEYINAIKQKGIALDALKTKKVEVDKALAEAPSGYFDALKAQNKDFADEIAKAGKTITDETSKIKTKYFDVFDENYNKIQGASDAWTKFEKDKNQAKFDKKTKELEDELKTVRADVDKKIEEKKQAEKEKEEAEAKQKKYNDEIDKIRKSFDLEKKDNDKKNDGTGTGSESATPTTTSDTTAKDESAKDTNSKDGEPTTNPNVRPVAKASEEEIAAAEKRIEALEGLANKEAGIVKDKADAVEEANNRITEGERSVLLEQTRIIEEQGKLKEEKDKKDKEIDEKAAKRKEKLEKIKKIKDKAAYVVQIAEATGEIAKGVAVAWAKGPIIGPPLAALVAVNGAIQIKTMTDQLMKMEQGGLLRGRRHSQGGMRVEGTNIEVEGGEYVVNRESTGKNMGLISYINRQRRQLKADDVNNYFAQPRSRAEVPLSSKFESGGYVTPSLDQKSEFDSKELIDAIRTMKIQPRVAVTDILRVQDEMVSVDGWSGM